MSTLIFNLLFLGFSTNLILCCLLTITAYNSISALVALIIAFINTTCLFFLMQLEFIGLLFLIVYVGAIAVLFLFSVMLFNLKDVIRSKTKSFFFKNVILLISLYIFYLFLFQFFINIAGDNMPNNLINCYFNNTNELINTSQNLTSFLANTELIYLGEVLYNKYCLYLILTAVILLITMIGAVILINSPKEQIQLQHITKQMTRGVTITNIK
jgi:NADH:ubiquinone oxidoreductase subunit 6 (subunit J)